jgi:hypothetical protein
MKHGCPGPSEQHTQGNGRRKTKSAGERSANPKSRERVVAPDPSSVWAEVSSIVEIEAQPPELPRWLRSS